VTLLVAVGRLTYVSDPISNASYVYDAKGRPTTVTTSNGVKTVYTYDNAGRTLSLTHKKTSDNSVLLSYTPTYDSTSARLSSVAEGPTSATTSYTYDAAGRLLTENRTGANPYASTYTYNSRGLRATAFRSEGGVTSHDGTYTYDNAGRLSTVVQPGLATENYTWWADSTLKTLPGQTSSYTRKLDYDEEGRLTLLQKDVCGTVTNLFEYGIGYDGARRSTRDIQNNSWTWLPCGVACCAGELTELSSDLSGSTWTTLGVGLRGRGLVRWNSDYSLTDFFGRPTAVGSSSGVTTAIFDAFNVRRGGSATLSRGAIRAIQGGNDDDGLDSWISSRLDQQLACPVEILASRLRSEPKSFITNAPLQVGFECPSRVPKPLPWWIKWTCRGHEQTAKKIYCNTCAALCVLYCEDLEGIAQVACFADCASRQINCKKGGFPPSF